VDLHITHYDVISSKYRIQVKCKFMKVHLEPLKIQKKRCIWKWTFPRTGSTKDTVTPLMSTTKYGYGMTSVDSLKGLLQPVTGDVINP